MAKKVLCIAVLMLALVCVLASCGHEHEFGEWETTQEATCIAKGVETRTCECGESETKPLAAKGHSDGKWITDKEANCTEDGSKHQICSVCEATIKTETITKLGHTDGEWITDKEANCTEDGSKHQICSVCEATIKTEALTKLGHSYDTNVIQNATASTKAVLEYDCNVCKHSYTQEIDSITVSARLSDYGTMISDQVYYYRKFEATATGGFGNYKYKFEVGSRVMQDFSSQNTIELYGNMFSVTENMQVKITVMDDLGQKSVYIIRGDGVCIDTYPIYE